MTSGERITDKRHKPESDTGDLTYVRNALTQISQAKIKIEEQKKQTVREIKSAVAEYAFPISGELPKSIIVAIETQETPEASYVSFIKYSPLRNTISSISFTRENHKLVKPLLCKEESSDWLKHGEEIIVKTAKARQVAKSGIEVTIPLQLSWFSNLPEGYDTPINLLETA